MCDYCDCRSIPLIEALSEDHEVVLALVADVRRALAGGRTADADATLAELLDLLDEHTAVEEASLFPALEATGGAGSTVEELEGDHREIERLAAAGATEALLALLERHVHREEHDVFPAARQLVPADRWDHVHRAAAGAGSGHR